MLATIVFVTRGKQGLVLGVYKPAVEGEVGNFTAAAKKIDTELDNKLKHALAQSGPKSLKLGKTRMFHGLHDKYPCIAVVCLGDEAIGFNESEGIDEAGHNVRVAAANGVRQLREVGQTSLFIDPATHPQAAAEGATLAAFKFDKLKEAKSRQPDISIACFTDHITNESKVTDLWERGVVLAEGQNFARDLMETPANLMTPTLFMDAVQRRLSELDVHVQCRDRDWIQSERMGAFLSVTRGSDEPPKFAELRYDGGGDGAPVALVGKGVTFDSGGISLKPSSDMDQMRGDMGGAACVAATILTSARLRLPINVRGFVALCENMPGSKATKPGDVVTARNGKTIQVMNTDAEGRLLLADTLNYAESCNPSHIISMATLTGAIKVALGSAVTGVFSTSTPLWQTLHDVGFYPPRLNVVNRAAIQAGVASGDRVWRMPLLEHYTKQVTDGLLADVDNLGNAKGAGGSCTAAAFLKEFVTHQSWMHLDIAGVMYNESPKDYLGKGMTGRPTWTMIEFLRNVAESG